MSLNMAEHREFVVRNMTAADIDLAIEWAASEGWNPGLHDAACFRHADPGGFFVGELHGEAIASLSAIAYDSDFGFIGLYIVKPAFRGQGLGLLFGQSVVLGQDRQLRRGRAALDRTDRRDHRLAAGRGGVRARCRRDRPGPAHPVGRSRNLRAHPGVRGGHGPRLRAHGLGPRRNFTRWR